MDRKLGNADKRWRVYVHRNGERQYLGAVYETTEELARCAALHTYGISEDEAEEGTLRKGIYQADDFSVEEEI